MAIILILHMRKEGRELKEVLQLGSSGARTEPGQAGFRVCVPEMPCCRC